MPQCPTHAVALVYSHTRFGGRHDCPEPGCTVACWDGVTSTPADAETRDLRRQCHELFDPLWKDRRRFPTRTAAYRWLARLMNVPFDRAHIGMFDRRQCRFLLTQLGGRPS